MRFIKAKKPIAANHKTLGELSVPDVEVPQFESMEEFVTATGGNDNALAYINGQVANGAKNVGRAVLRNADDNADKEKLYKTAADAVKNYTPEVSGVSVKSKAEQRDALVARLKDESKPLTREELLAILEAK